MHFSSPKFVPIGLTVSSPIDLVTLIMCLVKSATYKARLFYEMYFLFSLSWSADLHSSYGVMNAYSTEISNLLVDSLRHFYRTYCGHHQTLKVHVERSSKRRHLPDYTASSQKTVTFIHPRKNSKSRIYETYRCCNIFNVVNST
jgi:hypothetical protein